MLRQSARELHWRIKRSLEYVTLITFFKFERLLLVFSILLFNISGCLQISHLVAFKIHQKHEHLKSQNPKYKHQIKHPKRLEKIPRKWSGIQLRFCKHPVRFDDKVVSVGFGTCLFFRRLLPFPVCFKHLEESGQWAHWTLFDMHNWSQSAPLTLCSLHNLEHWSSVKGTLSVLVCSINVCKNFRFLRLCLSHLRLSMVRLLTLSCNLAIVFSWINTSNLRKSVKTKSKWNIRKSRKNTKEIVKWSFQKSKERKKK